MLTSCVTRPIRVLFVDDDISLLSGLRRSLRRYRDQWETSFADDGARALEQIEDQPVDVVVSDMRMPGIDGAELLTEIAGRFPGIVRFVLSGQAEQERIFQLASVAHQYFAKPCDTGLLFDAIDKVWQARARTDCPDHIHVLNGLPVVPWCPACFNELREALTANDSGIGRVANVIAVDPALSTKVLQLASSSFFGSPQKGVDVFRACESLGRDALKTLFLETGIFSGIATCLEHNDPHSRLEHVVSKRLGVVQGSTQARAITDYLLALWGIQESVGRKHCQGTGFPSGVTESRPGLEGLEQQEPDE